jgi:N-dimethylarginine dimethylaminohydrolase
MTEIQPNIRNEFAPLKTVVLGTAKDFGGIPAIETVYDPKSKEHILKGTFPEEVDLVEEMEAFGRVLERYGVNVLRPGVIIPEYNQIFTRDIAFVIDNTFVITHMLEDRAREIDALSDILSRIPAARIVDMRTVCPEGRAEGGDIMPIGDHIFIGYSEAEDFEHYTVARTNKRGTEFIAELFPHRKIRRFELVKSDEEARDNALHLDCCFQPLGLGHCLLYPGGFKHQSDVEFIRSWFGAVNCIEITRDEMYDMGSNVFSIRPDVVVSERGFTRINAEMRQRGYTVEEVKYSEIAKMEGLLRCTTLPIERVYPS